MAQDTTVGGTTGTTGAIPYDRVVDTTIADSTATAIMTACVSQESEDVDLNATAKIITSTARIQSARRKNASTTISVPQARSVKNLACASTMFRLVNNTVIAKCLDTSALMVWIHFGFY